MLHARGGPVRPWLVGLVLLMATGCGEGSAGSEPLTVTWNESEGKPACRYDPDGRRVEVRLRIDGEAGDHDRVVATVTAYADENTSDPLGSASRTVRTEGTVHQRLLLAIGVDRPPHVDEDGVAACKLAVTY